MAKTHTSIAIAHSELIHLPGASPTGARGKKKIRVTLVLRSSPLPKGHPARRKVRQILSARCRKRPALTQDEFEDFQCADEAHVEAVRRFARTHSLAVVAVSRARHDVVLEGSIEAFSEAFHVALKRYAHDAGVYRAHAGPVHIPAELRQAVTSVLGLDDIPLLRRPHPFRAATREHTARSFTTVDLAQHYRFPPDATGKGQTIALIQLGGGYHQSDIESYFEKLSIKLPAIEDSLVPGGPADPSTRNDPLDRKTIREIFRAVRKDPEMAQQDYIAELSAFRDTVEVTMDLEIAGSLAPGAEFVVVFAPGTAPGLYAALQKAMEVGATVISISWGFHECDLNAHQVQALNRVLHDASLKGVTVCCATGDDGSRATGPAHSNGLANVNYPASSPYALACGGTALCCAGSAIAEEVVWNDTVFGVRVATGGGISGLFPLPLYQKEAGVPSVNGSARRKTWLSRAAGAQRRHCGRGVPDVAANADHDSGYQILVGGSWYVGFGTSAVAPLWAALVARLNERLGCRLGWLHHELYHPEVARTFRPVTRGNNDVTDGRIASYRARRGWNACTGLGTPDGERLLRALQRVRSASIS